MTRKNHPQIVHISTGPSSGGPAGDVELAAGTSSGGPGGAVRILSGRNTVGDLGGSASVEAGSGHLGGGPLRLAGGRDLNDDPDLPTESSGGGEVVVEGGPSVLGRGGTVTISAGASRDGGGGGVIVRSGSSEAMPSGDATLATAGEERSSGPLWFLPFAATNIHELTHSISLATSPFRTTMA